MVGGIGSFTTNTRVLTPGSMYPYAPILFDYVRRAMPMDRPQSLTNEEVYALSAYLLHLNGLMPADAVLDATTLIAVQMPNLTTSGGPNSEVGIRNVLWQNFQTTVDAIDARWGSVDGYLHGEIGLSRADIAKLRRLYLE